MRSKRTLRAASWMSSHVACSRTARTPLSTLDDARMLRPFHVMYRYRSNVVGELQFGQERRERVCDARDAARFVTLAGRQKANLMVVFVVVAKLSHLAVPKMEWPIPVPGHASIMTSAAVPSTAVVLRWEAPETAASCTSAAGDLRVLLCC